MHIGNRVHLTALTFLAAILFAGVPLAGPGQSPEHSIIEPAILTLDQVGTGNLLVRTSTPGSYIAAPMIATDVQINVTGTIARTTIIQRFENPSNAWVEAVYAFPLPDTAAVDRLRLRVGDRFIEGQVKEREEARKVYEEAKESGTKASLVEQQRPNLFTNEVANIGPGEVVVVEIEYQEVVRIDDGAFHLRFPMVTGPRYNPPAGVATTEADGKTQHVLIEPVPNRDKLPNEGRYVDAANDPTKAHLNPLTLSVSLNAGFPIAEIDTPFHKTKLSSDKSDSVTIELAAGSVPANRDFELTWRAESGAAPHVSLFKETKGNDDYLLLSLVPPDGTPQTPNARELILVIDISGSMSGASIIQARAAALDALNRLTDRDRVNVIVFNTGVAQAFSAPRQATSENLSAARAFVSALEANGGTEMLPALILALDEDGADAESGLLRQVVFMTDGAVGNEALLFSAIDSLLGRSRLFTVGIGSAPNSFFMTRAARMGRGTFTYIGNPNQVQARMATLFRKLESPVLTDIQVSWPQGIDADVWPDTMPDLYQGEPVVLSARPPQLAGTLRVSGMLAGKPWRTEVNLDHAAAGIGVATLWARHKIAGWEEERYRGGSVDDIKAQITTLALEHHLVSAHTSLVAIDITPSRPDGEPIYSKNVPLLLPEGWEWEGVFAEPGRITPMPRHAEDYTALIAPKSPPGQQSLPRGATPATLNIILGLLALAFGLLLILYWFRPLPIGAPNGIGRR